MTTRLSAIIELVRKLEPFTTSNEWGTECFGCGMIRESSGKRDENGMIIWIQPHESNCPVVELRRIIEMD